MASRVCRSPIAPPSRTCRRNSARPAPSFPSMRKPFAISSSPAATPEQIALVEAYAKAQGLWRIERGAGGRLHRRGRARSVHRRALARRAQAAAGPCAAALRQERLPHEREENGRGAFPEESHRDRHCRRQTRRRDRRGQGRRRADRRDHELHQHLEPRRAGGRRAARAQCKRHGAHVQAVGQDLARAGLARGHRLSAERPDCSPIWRRWASTPWATAAPRASATRAP